MRRLSIQFVEQSLCLQKIRNIETLSEPPVNRLKSVGIALVAANLPNSRFALRS